MTPRVVTLVLCVPGRVLGVLPPFTVGWAYWQSVDDVVERCAAVHGVEVVVLRVLSAEGAENGDGGPVTYLAQVDAEVAGRGSLPLTPWAGRDPLRPHPLRAGYASPDGPHADLGWASRQVASFGGRVTGAVRQVRTWNLSSVWTIPTDRGRVWLKVLPSFLAHEAGLLALLARVDDGVVASVVPEVLAAEGGRVLMDDVPGEDQYGGSVDVVGEAIDSLVRVQAVSVGLVDDLLALGLPDRRRGAVEVACRDLVERYRGQLDGQTAAAVEALVEALPDRFAQARASGLPDGLVHGDFYPGNVRGLPGAFRLLDWGDARVGHPVLDVLRLREVVPERDRSVVTQRWVGAWERDVAGARPEEAIAPLAPVAELFHALTFDAFLDAVEPDERVYHAGDPVACLREAARMTLVGGTRP